MKILRLSTLSLPLAAAAIFLSGPSPASAEMPDCDGMTPKHPSCKPKPPPDDTSDTKYDVEMIESDDVTGELTTTAACIGLNKGSKLHAVFPGDFDSNKLRVGCAEFTITAAPPYNGATLHLGEIAVTQQNTRVILFFTKDNSMRQFPDNTDGFQTLRLDATTTSDNGVITLTVDQQVVQLTKSHRPDKGLPVGTIAVGAFRYTPVED